MEAIVGKGQFGEVYVQVLTSVLVIHVNTRRPLN